MKKFLRVNEDAFVAIDNITSVVMTKNNQSKEVRLWVKEGDNEWHITDGRTLSDIMAEIEGEAEEKVCKWTRSKNEPDNISAPHLDKRDGESYYCCYEGWLKENPYCAICGGRIEVQDE